MSSVPQIPVSLTQTQIKSSLKVRATAAHKSVLNSMNSNWAVEEYVARRRAAGTLTRSDRVYHALASPGSSVPALLLAIFLLISGFVSVLMAAVQLSAEASDVSQQIPCEKMDPTQVACDFNNSHLYDMIFLFIFGLEVIVRFFVYIKPWKDFFIWVDIFCLVPLFLRSALTIQGYRPFELEESMRIFLLVLFALAPLRLLKLARYSSAAMILKKAILDSSAALWIPFYLLAVLFTFFGGVVFAFEYDPSITDDGSRVQTVLEAWWMMLVTMVTVGYGDFSPRTNVGRVLTSFAMCLGLCFTAMPLAIVGNTFSTAWEARSLALISEKIRRHLLQTGHTNNSLEAAFADFDQDSNGSIDYREFKNFLINVLEVPLDVKKLRKVWRALDQDDSGIIRYTEFCLAIFPEVDVDVATEVAMATAPHAPHKGAHIRRQSGTPVLPMEPAHERIEVCADLDVEPGATRAPANALLENRLAALESSMQAMMVQQQQLGASMREVLDALRVVR